MVLLLTVELALECDEATFWVEPEPVFRVLLFREELVRVLIGKHSICIF